MTTTNAPAVALTLDSPTGSAGAVAVFRLTTDDPAAAERVLGAPLPAVGAISLRRVLDHDDALLIRVDQRTTLVTPHGGPANTRALLRAMHARGATEPPRTDPRQRFPEAADIHEARVLDALAAGASPAAVDLLLAQPARWRADPSATDTAPAALDTLLRDARIVVVGRENIGKSTLLNAMARDRVALAADHHGTTRDHVGIRVLVEGARVLWIDTPGIPSGAPISTQVAALLSAADLVVHAFDANAAPDIDLQTTNAPIITAALRADRAAAPPSADAVTSATQGTGLAELATTIRRTLVPDAALRDPRPWRFWAD